MTIMARDVTAGRGPRIAPAEPAHPVDPGEPFLEVAGVEGSYLRATPVGLTVMPCPGGAARPELSERLWRYEELRAVRLDDYGSLGVIRARIRASGDELPLLLLEPDQITSARRVLEMVWNLMAAHGDRRVSA